MSLKERLSEPQNKINKIALQVVMRLIARPIERFRPILCRYQSPCRPIHSEKFCGLVVLIWGSYTLPNRLQSAGA